ncbi:MAG TPA: hypothetical protein PLW74_01870 [Candidatus Dojkabacteria bacterium]|nr:hypothetical protein [Candidatus Dojkabacteria bacterium]
MQLYRATKRKDEVIEPQKVHPTDYHKFPDEKRPEKVIWAASIKEEALMHGLMDGESYSLGIESKENSSGDSQFVSGCLKSKKPLEELFAGRFDEKIYLYEFNAQGFTQVGNGSEYYKEGEIKNFTTKTYTVVETIQLLKESNVEFRVENQFSSESQAEVKLS